MLRGTSPCAWSLPLPPPVEGAVGAVAAVAGQEVVVDESFAGEVVVVAGAEGAAVGLLCCVACCDLFCG